MTKKRAANFQVDTRLAILLGEGYRSTEQAIKELVDNAWDADAENVVIVIPLVTDKVEVERAPIVVADDGHGMTEQEIRDEYLKVARDRRTAKGEKTLAKGRRVKGRKGVGKFAGLAAADVMTVRTCRAGSTTQIRIPKTEILEANLDLERINLPIESTRNGCCSSGTTIILTDLNQRLAFPDANALRELLVHEYGREPGIRISVNGVNLDLEDLPGETYTCVTEHEQAGDVRLRFRITEENQKKGNQGIVLRAGPKIVGRPSFFGLDEDPEIPPVLLKRLSGEVEVSGLADDVMLDWGGIRENSLAYRYVQGYVRAEIKRQLEVTCSKHIAMTRQRLEREIKRRLSAMPEHRRTFAEQAIEKIIGKFYGEREERIAPIVGVVLDALERDEYWVVLQKMDAARHGDVEVLAEALVEFGVLETALICQHARRRREFLDDLAVLAANPATLEAEMHRALERSLWIMGYEYGLLASNQALKTIISRYTDTRFVGERARHRPDLLMVSNVSGRHVLIEFKRPNHKIDREDEYQAVTYRDEFRPYINPLEIVLIGGTIEPSLRSDIAPGVTHLTYMQVISRACAEIDWMLENLVSSRVESMAVR